MSGQSHGPQARALLDEIAELSAALPAAVVRKIYAQTCQELIEPHPALRRFAKRPAPKPPRPAASDQE